MAATPDRLSVALSFTVTSAFCQPDATLAAQGANSATGTAVDNAGNKGTTTVSGINVDTVAPVVSIGGVKDGAEYVIGAVPTPTASATDATSGLAAAATGTLSGGTANGVGSFTYTATATDKAGNTQTMTGSYAVRYRFDGFLQPINDTGHVTTCGTSCVVSVFKGGSTVPVKFQLKDAAGNIIQANAAPVWLGPAKGNATTAPIDEATFADPIDTTSTFRWDATDQQYHFNWGTPKTGAGFYWKIGVDLDDGSRYTVDVGLR